MTLFLEVVEERMNTLVAAGERGDAIGVRDEAHALKSSARQVGALVLGDLLDDEVLMETQPVVFIGPYEHHSNELSWRQSLATTVQVRLDAAGHLAWRHLVPVIDLCRFHGLTRVNVRTL